MIISEHVQNIVLQDTAGKTQDTSLIKIILSAAPAAKTDSSGLIRNTEFSAQENISLQLKDGKEIPPQPFNGDWIVAIVLLSAFVYATISTFSGKFLREVKFFLLFKEIDNPSLIERKTHLYLQPGIVNLISFSNVALFGYCTADYYNFIPFGISGFLLWLLFLTIVTTLVTLRHIVCLLIGNISGKTGVFGEYSFTVSQSYRITGFLLFLLSILLTYINLIHPETILVSGLILSFTVYILRISRLFLIFLKRNISILYLILYLCALEILPILILLRYFTDLF